MGALFICGHKSTIIPDFFLIIEQKNFMDGKDHRIYEVLHILPEHRVTSLYPLLPIFVIKNKKQIFYETKLTKPAHSQRESLHGIFMGNPDCLIPELAYLSKLD